MASLKRKSRFNSLSTPGMRQDTSNYLVGLVFLRSNRGIKMPPKFWSQTRYKFRYMREIKACRKFIKAYGEQAMLYVAKKNYLTTFTDYAQMEVLLQKFKEGKDRTNADKDLSPIKSESRIQGKDLRDFVKPVPEKKGLFQKLEELENG
jgi:hypothetical protein